MNKWGLAFCSIFVLGFMSLMLATCDIFNSITDEGGFTPSTEQMVSALKEALKKGAENAGIELSIEDAFYKNPERRIPLPPEAQPILNNISRIPGLQQQVDDLVFRINRAAEEASKEVGLIFGEAITLMNIEEAAHILKGSDTEATNYLKGTTTDPLKTAFGPALNKALSKPIIAGISAQQSWDTVVTAYNQVANSPANILLGLQPVNADINEFVLDMALRAVFNKMAEVEKNIRANPIEFLTKTATKVFNWAKETAGL